MVEVNGTNIETDVQGFLQHMDEWSEDFAKELAWKDGIKLFNDHWEPIYYFREYHAENMTSPTMHTLVHDLGAKNKSHHEQKAYKKHIYAANPVMNEKCLIAVESFPGDIGQMTDP